MRTRAQPLIMKKTKLARMKNAPLLKLFAQQIEKNETKENATKISVSELDFDPDLHRFLELVFDVELAEVVQLGLSNIQNETIIIIKGKC